MTKIIEITEITKEYHEGFYTEYETIYKVVRNDGTVDEVYSVDSEMQEFMKTASQNYADFDILVYSNPFEEHEVEVQHSSNYSEEPSGWTADIYPEIFELA